MFFVGAFYFVFIYLYTVYTEDRIKLDVTFSISIMYVLVLMHYSRKRHMNFKLSTISYGQIHNISVSYNLHKNINPLIEW